MGKKVEIEVEVKDNTDASIKRLKELKKQLRDVPTGTAEWKKLYNEIDDLEDKIKGSKQASADWVDTLESAGGPLGAVGAAINKVKVATVSWGTAIKATGIGLLVSLIGGLVAAFSSVENSGKKFEKLIIGFEKIFQGILGALEPVIDGFVSLAESALPIVTDAFRVAYSAVSSFLQGIGKLGQAVMKVIKGDFSGAWESAKEAVTGFGARYEAASNKFIASSNELTKTEKKNLKEQEDARQKALDEKIKQMEANDKLDEARLEKQKQEALALAKTEQEKLNVEVAFAKKSYDLKVKDLNDKMALYSKDSVEYKALLAEKIKLEGDYINTTAQNKEKQKDINDKANKDLLDSEVQAIQLKKAKGEITEAEYQKSLFDIKKKYVTDKKELGAAEIEYENFLTEEKKKNAEKQRAIAFGLLQDQLDALDRANQAKEDDFLEDNKRLEAAKILLQQQRDIELQAAENDAQKQLEIKKKYADAIFNVETAITNNNKAQAEQRIAIQMMYADVVGQFGNFLQQVAGKNKGLAKAGVIIENAAGIAKIIINTQANAAKAGYLSPKGIAELAAGVIGVAASIAATVKAVKQIDAQDATGGGKGAAQTAAPQPQFGQNYERGGFIGGRRHAQGGTLIEAEAGEAIMNRGSVQLFGPLLSALNQMGGGTNFNPNLLVTSPDAPKVERPAQEAAPQIIKTYVIANEITNEVEKQGRLKELSTL